MLLAPRKTVGNKRKCTWCKAEFSLLFQGVMGVWKTHGSRCLKCFQFNKHKFRVVIANCTTWMPHWLWKPFWHMQYFIKSTRSTNRALFSISLLWWDLLMRTILLGRKIEYSFLDNRCYTKAFIQRPWNPRFITCINERSVNAFHICSWR